MQFFNSMWLCVRWCLCVCVAACMYATTTNWKEWIVLYIFWPNKILVSISMRAPMKPDDDYKGKGALERNVPTVPGVRISFGHVPLQNEFLLLNTKLHVVTHLHTHNSNIIIYFSFSQLTPMTATISIVHTHIHADARVL